VGGGGVAQQLCFSLTSAPRLYLCFVDSKFWKNGKYINRTLIEKLVLN
jgi:hypothetical protein